MSQMPPALPRIRPAHQLPKRESDSTLWVRYGATGDLALDAGSHHLAQVRYASPAASKDKTGAATGLEISACLPALTPGPSIESWLCAEAPSFDEQLGFQLARTTDLVFGSATLDANLPLESGTQDLYERLLQLNQGLGVRPVRLWNVVPRLHEVPHQPGSPADLDRYMLFCKGRAAAFESHFGAGFETRLPACSAVGSQEGPLLLYFLSSTEGSTYLENPRQMAAYSYPPRYGPRSPSFARAAMAPESAGSWQMISGTASILGHASVHPEDVVEQTLETLRNMRVLVHGSEGMHRPLTGHLQTTKVYLRHREHLPEVQGLMQAELGPEADVLYVIAEVCRPELLVEIEGLARCPDTQAKEQP